VGKGGRCVGLTTYHLHMPNVLKSGSLNLLEPSGSAQACNGIALPVIQRNSLNNGNKQSLLQFSFNLRLFGRKAVISQLFCA